MQFNKALRQIQHISDLYVERSVSSLRKAVGFLRAHPGFFSHRVSEKIIEYFVKHQSKNK